MQFLIWFGFRSVFARSRPRTVVNNYRDLAIGYWGSEFGMKVLGSGFWGDVGFI